MVRADSPEAQGIALEDAAECAADIKVKEPEERPGSSWSGIPGQLDPHPSPERIAESLTHEAEFFKGKACDEIEKAIDETVALAAAGAFRGPSTVDKTSSRTKYFFGKGYTYGWGKRGSEELLGEGEVDPIPEWMKELLVAPLEEAGILERGWVDSVVMNDYGPGSSIVAHVDPPTLFERPVVTVSFFSKAYLVFGASFDPARKRPPAFRQLLERGSVLLLRGYAADAVTHGIRPEDLLGDRRVSVVLRHVSTKAKVAESTLAESLPEPILPPMLLWAMQAATWGPMICEVQGYWTSSRVTYVIQGWSVTAMVTGQRSSTWPLVPTPGGLQCQDLLLDPAAVFASRRQRLTWWMLGRCFGAMVGQLPGRRPRSGSTWTWLRLEQ